MIGETQRSEPIWRFCPFWLACLFGRWRPCAAGWSEAEPCVRMNELSRTSWLQDWRCGGEFLTLAAPAVLNREKLTLKRMVSSDARHESGQKSHAARRKCICLSGEHGRRCRNGDLLVCGLRPNENWVVWIPAQRRFTAYQKKRRREVIICVLTSIAYRRPALFSDPAAT